MLKSRAKQKNQGLYEKKMYLIIEKLLMTFPSPAADQSEHLIELILYSALAIFIFNSTGWLLCQTLGKRDNSYIDIMWGISFIIPNILIILLRSQVYN